MHVNIPSPTSIAFGRTDGTRQNHAFSAQAEGIKAGDEATSRRDPSGWAADAVTINFSAYSVYRSDGNALGIAITPGEKDPSRKNSFVSTTHAYTVNARPDGSFGPDTVRIFTSSDGNRPLTLRMVGNQEELRARLQPDAAIDTAASTPPAAAAPPNNGIPRQLKSLLSKISDLARTLFDMEAAGNAPRESLDSATSAMKRLAQQVAERDRSFDVKA